MGYWDLESPADIQPPAGYGMIFTRDSKTLLVGNRLENDRNEPYRLSLWDTLSQKQVGFWPFVAPYPTLPAMAISADGRTLALGGQTGSDRDVPLHLWDIRSAVVRRTIKAHERRNNGVAFSRDGKLLASTGERDRSVRIWEATTGLELLRFEGHAAEVNCVDFSPDGCRLVSGSADTTIIIWDLQEGGRKRLQQARNDLALLWTTLASDRAQDAYESMLGLALGGNKAVDVLAQHLRPTPEEKDRKPSVDLIEDLNHMKFTIRDKAARILRERGWEPAAELKQSMKKPPSMDVRRALERLWSGLENYNPEAETLRRERAIQALERIGSEPAIKLLKRLAEGAAWSEQTRDAKAALFRLQHHYTHAQKCRDFARGLRRLSSVTYYSGLVRDE